MCRSAMVSVSLPEHILLAYKVNATRIGLNYVTAKIDLLTIKGLNTTPFALYPTLTLYSLSIGDLHTQCTSAMNSYWL